MKKILSTIVMSFIILILTFCYSTVLPQNITLLFISVGFIGLAYSYHLYHLKPKS